MSAIDLVDLWQRRHDLTKDEWLDAAPVLLGVSVANADTITRLQAALEPFAAMGRLMDSRATITFGKVVPDSEIVCSSSGEVGLGVLCMGHFRDALALCPNAPGWGGMYRPPFVRSSVGGE